MPWNTHFLHFGSACNLFPARRKPSIKFAGDYWHACQRETGKIAAGRQMKPVPHAVKYTFLALWLRLWPFPRSPQPVRVRASRTKNTWIRLCSQQGALAMTMATAMRKSKTISLHVQHTLLNTILCRHSMTTTWNSLTGRFMEQKEANTPPLDYEQCLCFLSPCSDTRATRKWPRGRARALPSLIWKRETSPSLHYLSFYYWVRSPRIQFQRNLPVVHLAF